MRLPNRVATGTVAVAHDRPQTADQRALQSIGTTAALCARFRQGRDAGRLGWGSEIGGHAARAFFRGAGYS